MHLSEQKWKNAPRRLLILASKLGYQTRGFASAAEALGVEVRFGTDRCHKLDDPWGDGAVPLHFEAAEEAAQEIVRQFAGHPPHAVLALGDRPTPAAACAARRLGLAGNEPTAVRTCRNKLAQREALRAAHLPVPEFFAWARGEDWERAVSRVKFPCVIKPLSLAASQGVIRADDPDRFRDAVLRIGALLDTPEIRATREPDLDRLLVEEYLGGREVAVEGLLDRGRLRILAIFDKPDPLEGPFFEESIYVTPSRLPEPEQAAIRECASEAARALHLTHGPLHAEFRVDEKGPWVLEIAPRPIGGLCSRALRFGRERISLEELLIRHALGFEGWDAEREADASGVMMIPVPKSGIFERVDGRSEAGAVPGVTAIQMTARRKDYLAAWPEGSSYLGFIFARAERPAEVEWALRQAHAKLRFTFSSRLSVQHPVSGKVSA